MTKFSRELLEVYRITAEALRGHERRIFMAQIVKILGPGGQRFVERELGWNRGTVRKGLQELELGRRITRSKRRRGRKRAEELLPNLLDDIARLRRRGPLSTGQLQRRLIRDCGYAAAELPTRETLRKKLRLVEEQWNIS